jgi:thiamine biosynthesis protein ThiI
VAKHPVTKPVPEKIRESEKIVYDEMLPMVEKAVNEAELIWCDGK